MSFLSREKSLQARVEKWLLLIWTAIYIVLLFFGLLSGRPHLVVISVAAALTSFLFIAVRRRFGVPLKDWLDGGY